MRSSSRRKRLAAIFAIATAMGVVPATGGAVPPAGNPATYTLDTHFDEGTLVNVNHDAPNNDQLQLDEQPTPFEFIWVAASNNGTIVKIDTVTGQVLGEYLSSPTGLGRDPSRTTVDGNGNVWSGNRGEATGGSGSVVKIGLLENGQCVDRNTNGVIDTSTGLGDVRAWTNAGGADTNGGVSTAQDECIIVFERTPGAPNVRHVSVDANNDVWIGGYPFLPTAFHHLDGTTGASMGTFSAAALGCGGYGGLIDGNGVLWSASIGQSQLLRYDTNTATGSCIPVQTSYGLGIDAAGFVWNAMWTANTIVKVSPSGVIQPGFPVITGGVQSRGVVATPDGDIWVANSGSNTVTRLSNTGALKATIPVGSVPTGVAVDAAGMVWVTNQGSDNVMRIDPATDAVNLTVGVGAFSAPYNYSDMTGSTLIAPPNAGTWSVIHDIGIVGAMWREVSWTSDEPGDSVISVKVASSTDGITFGPEVAVANGADPAVADGQYLKVIVSFARSTTTDADGNGINDSPILFDLTLLANRPPDCTDAAPSIGLLWPPNHKFVPVEVLGVTDPDGDPVTITIDGIRQDEPVDTIGDGTFAPDGDGVGTGTALVRAERTGVPAVPGNGRVYHIAFTADDGFGLTCSATVNVGVPHDKKDVPVDDGPLFDSTTS